MKRNIVSFAVVLVLLTLVTLAPTSPSLADRAERVLVEFAPGRAAAVRGALERAGGNIHYQFDRLNLLAVTLPAAALDGIARNPNVVAMAPDTPRYPMEQTTPWGIDRVQAPQVWNEGVDGSGPLVCIIDSGLYTAHEDFAGVNVVGGYPSGWNTDGCGHGTHVAGTITAAENTKGVVGVSPGDVSLYIVKVFGDDCSWSYSSDLIDATDRCYDAGADIISMSLGGGTPRGPWERNQFNWLWDQGILSIAAAGNAGDTSYSYPASHDSVVSVAATDEGNVVADFSQQNDQVELAAPGVDVLSTVPWLATNTLTVDGATYSANHIEYAAYGSASGALVDGGLCDSTGSWTDNVVLCARGEISFYDKVMNVQNSGGAAAVIYNNEPGNFLGTLGEGYSSDIVAISLSQEDGQYLVTNKLGQNGDVVSTEPTLGSGYEAWQGTSMATPHVSGVAALLWSSNSALTNADIRDAMNATALDLGAAGRDNAYGYGLVQAYAALQYLGGGGNNPPTVTITSPTDGASFNSGESISFAGSASDAEDGDLTASLVWTSDKDGQIGTGGSFSAVPSDGTHTITASVTDSGGSTGDDSITITVGGGGGGTMYVFAIDMSSKTAGPNRSAIAVVTILDTTGNPVDGTTVYGTWSGGYSGSTSGTTAADGTVRFESGKVRQANVTFTFTVDNVEKTGYTYDATLNVETSDSITVP
jgi:subtilisin family serine protease